MKELILCGTNGLLQYVRHEVERDGRRTVYRVVDDISEIKIGRAHV